MGSACGRICPLRGLSERAALWGGKRTVEQFFPERIQLPSDPSKLRPKNIFPLSTCCYIAAMTSSWRSCPRCPGQATKRNGVRARDGAQQYLCLECSYQWAESRNTRDPLICMLRAVGIDARRHGIFNAVVRFAQGQSMALVEQKTGVKAETLKGHLENVRRYGLTSRLEELLKKKARLSSSDLEAMREFWLECEFTQDAYWRRGQDLIRSGEWEKTLRQRSGGTASRRPARRP